MTIDEAVRCLRQDPAYTDLVRDAYLGRDVVDSMERFATSSEFEEVRRLIGPTIVGATVLDLGAGTGIASAAFLRAGAGHVIAVEPDASDEVGRGALGRTGLDVQVIDAVGESLPIPTGSVDIVYARQVLHHARDLDALMDEAARVLRPGGRLLACREHVVSDRRELEEFLSSHPIHRLAGGENAFTLSRYRTAIERSGLRVDRVIGPWESIINAYPTVRSAAELRTLPRDRLVRRWGGPGRLVARIPGVQAAVRARIARPIPGRLYTFLATKP